MYKNKVIEKVFTDEDLIFFPGNIKIFRLENVQGNYVEVTNYGAIVKSIVVNDRFGNKDNVVLAYPSLQGYIDDPCYIGVTVGPFANRIKNAAFTLDGKAYRLDKNDGENNNHSGTAGFHKKVFDCAGEDSGVVFTLKSAHGDGGFPGNLDVTVKYAWTDDNELIIDYIVTTDTPTPVNLTNHAYFNLSGCTETIQGHKLDIAADCMLETAADHVPTGRVLPVGAMRFNGQLLQDVMCGSGINTYYIYDKGRTGAVCELYHATSGRFMQVYTSYPGVQLYTGDFLTGKHISAHGKKYGPFDGLCLECQFYPDSPNHNGFPDTILRPGQIYKHSIVYKFGIR